MVHELVINGNDLPFVLSEAICPADTRKTILTKAGGDTEADLMDVNEFVAQYLRRADKAFDAVVDHAHDRAEYDKNYFLGQLVQMIDKIIDKIDDLEVSIDASINLSRVDLRNAFQGFVVCIAPQKGSTVMCPVPSVSVRIDEIVQLLRKQFDYARMLLSIAFEAIADLVDQYNMLKASLRSLADSKFLDFFLLHNCCSLRVLSLLTYSSIVHPLLNQFSTKSVNFWESRLMLPGSNSMDLTFVGSSISPTADILCPPTLVPFPTLWVFRPLIRYGHSSLREQTISERFLLQS
jgi:hypothetical protein